MPKTRYYTRFFIGLEITVTGVLAYMLKVGTFIKEHDIYKSVRCKYMENFIPSFPTEIICFLSHGLQAKRCNLWSIKEYACEGKKRFYTKKAKIETTKQLCHNKVMATS